MENNNNIVLENIPRNLAVGILLNALCDCAYVGKVRNKRLVNGEDLDRFRDRSRIKIIREIVGWSWGEQFACITEVLGVDDDFIRARLLNIMGGDLPENVNKLPTHKREWISVQK